METYQVRLLKASFAEVANSPELAAEFFYDELFHRSPETRALFKEDLSDQRKTLIDTLEMAVNGVSMPDHLFAYVEDLGRRHAGYGVARAHYESAGVALIWMLEQVLGDGFTDDTRESWEILWGRIAGTMISARDEALHSEAADRARRPLGRSSSAGRADVGGGAVMENGG